MQVDYRFSSRSGGKDVKQPNLQVHLVFPGGQIKTQRVSTNIDNPWLVCEYIYEGKRRVGIKHVDLSGPAKRAGMLLLKEEFEKMGWPEGYAQYIEFYRQARVRSKKAPPYPDDALPESVLELRRRAKAPLTTENIATRPDSRPKKPKSAAQESSQG